MIGMFIFLLVIAAVIYLIYSRTSSSGIKLSFVAHDHTPKLLFVNKLLSIVNGLLKNSHNSSENQVSRVKAEFDNRLYMVQEIPNKQKASLIMAELNLFMMKFITLMHILAKLPLNKCSRPNMVCSYKKRAGIYSKIDTESLLLMFRKSSNITLITQLLIYRDLGHLTYNLLKEDQIYKLIVQKNKYILNLLMLRYDPKILRLVRPTNGTLTSFLVGKKDSLNICLRSLDFNFLNMDVIKFVVLHLIAHMGTLTYGHDNNFWATFKLFLTIACRYKLFKNLDFSKKSELYCGMKIMNSPYFNSTIDLTDVMWLKYHTDTLLAYKYLAKHKFYGRS